MFGKTDIGGGFADFWQYIREDRPHRWPVWGLALTLTGLLFWGFSEKLIRPEPPRSKIVYFENWSAGRTQADVEAEWVERAKAANQRNAERRATYQRLADQLGIEYDASEAEAASAAVGTADGKDAAGKTAPPPAPTVRRPSLAERAAGAVPASPAEPRP